MKFINFKTFITYSCFVLLSFLQIQCSKDDEMDSNTKDTELTTTGEMIDNEPTVVEEEVETILTEAEELLILVNASRAQEGLDPLILNDALTKAALAHSIDMEINDYFSHTSLDGTTPSERTKAAGYEGTYRAENIAWNQKTPEKVHEAWINSEGHKAAILSDKTNEMGLGHNGAYWTQLFGFSNE